MLLIQLGCITVNFGQFIMPVHRQVRRTAFSYAGPSPWNTLPRHIRETVDSLVLKTHYFTSAFGVV